jgi:dihydroorotate dehydrogenase (fumarate)
MDTSMSDLSVEYCGVALRSPIVVAPAAISETAERLKRCEDHGAGAAVIKSYFEREVCRVAPTPRFEVLRRPLGRHETFTLYSYEQAHIYGLADFGRELARAASACEMPIFSSINCVTPEGWTEAARVSEQAGARLIELNVSCPHGVHAMSGADPLQAMTEALAAARARTTLPLVLKLTPQMANPVAAVVGLERAGASGVVMFNRLTGLDINLDTEAPILHGGYAGHGGPWALHLVLRWITETYPHTRLPLAASGGVSSGGDVAKLILAGATVVETCTAVVMNGYDVLPRLEQGLRQFMEAKGYERLAEFRGKVIPRILNMDQVHRRHDRYAAVDPERCTECGTCLRVCIYNAVNEGEPYAIAPETCDGCGLCAQLCPERCIEMRPIE